MVNFDNSHSTMIGGQTGGVLTVDSVTNKEETNDSVKERSGRSVRSIKVSGLVPRERVQSCLLSGS